MLDISRGLCYNKIIKRGRKTMAKKKIKQSTASTYRAVKKLRNDWGDISPITRVIPNKKKPKRHPKHKGVDL